jgi:hypothetical protein
MSATLCEAIDDHFMSGAEFDGFFRKAESKRIREVFEPRELQVLGKPGESCKTNIFFGFFFDGTSNNYENAEVTKDHSNVARLYDCYPGLSVPKVLPASTDWQYKPDDYRHFFKVYIPGIASPFPAVKDTGQDLDQITGGAGGALGESRIIWALAQAVNNVHRYFHKAPLITSSDMDRLLRRVELTKHARSLMERSDSAYGSERGNYGLVQTREEFKGVLQRLHAAVSAHWPNERTGKPEKIDPGTVKTIYVSTFGFSRGATEARAFTNWLQSLCKLDAALRGKSGGMSLGGFNVEFDFLGLFDTVASVGMANSGRIADGHWAWADAEDSLRIPEGVKKCLHLVAAHEVRRSFPVDSVSINGALPEGCQEIVLPGAHSDVGCGYCPCEQGRGSDPNGDDMLSRIPLLMMYKAARLNGVPLKLEFASSTAKGRFALSKKTIEAFNAYIGTCKVTHGPIHQIMREQARKHIEWRFARRVSDGSSIEKTESFSRATAFHQNDLFSAALEFEDEIKAYEEWLWGKGDFFAPGPQQPGFANLRSREWEEIASWWRETRGRPAVPSAEVLRFFDDYVHDSRASFKCLGDPGNEAEMHKFLRKLVALQNTRLPVVVGKADYHSASAGMTQDQRRAAEEYSKTGKIPRMIQTGRETGALMEAGYLRFRKIYGGSDNALLS